MLARGWFESASPPSTPSSQSPLSRFKDSQPRVLTIQSHVVHGFVGNKSAVFPLQLLGFEVEQINSVQFSNHTGYPTFKGEVLQGDKLWEIVQGLEANNLLDSYTHLLTGYIGSESFLRTVLDLVARLRKTNPELVYFCDPVLGDHGKLYVPEALLEVYKEEVVRVATVLTPNQFEAQMLTGIEIHNRDDAARACNALHSKGVKTVIITSFDWGDEIEMFASQVEEAGKTQRYRIVVPRFHGYSFTGTGDLTAALLLAWTHKHALPYAMEHACATLQAVCRLTIRGAEPNTKPPPELRLVQSKSYIEKPQVIYKVQHMGRPIRGVIFDMDGTLTLPGQIDVAEIRRRLKLSEVDNAGCPCDVVRAVHEQLPHESQTAAMAVIEEVELRSFEQVALMPGLTEMVGALADLQVVGSAMRPMGLAIATSNCRRAVGMMLDAAHISADAFNPIMTRDSEFGKPDPRVAMAICEEWGILPSEVLLVGDSLNDMRCARGSGCYSCIVLNDANVALSENSQLVDFVVRELGEILPIIQQTNRAVGS